MQSFSNVLLVGMGTMGRWVASKIAATTSISVFDTNSAALESMQRASHEQGVPKIKTAPSLEEGAKDADLILEMISEDISAKKAFYETVDQVARDQTIFASNSSILLPEDFNLPARRRKHFCHFHFYMPDTAVDIMPTKETDPEVVRKMTAFAKSIGESPIIMKKPHRGYIFSAIAGAATDVALGLLSDDVASIETIDESWRKITKTPLGPFQQLDMIGLDTSLKIREIRLKENGPTPDLEKAIQVLREKVQAGKLGRKSGKGFYTY